MCGRYASTRSELDLATLFDALDETDGGLTPDYNLAPTDPAPIVRLGDAAQRTLSIARWGLIPPWARSGAKPSAAMINARAETVATSRAFADSFARRRCLVPADGWYEWRPTAPGGAKQPYFMTVPAGVTFAGIWSSGVDARPTFSVITLPAAGHLALVHDRMPLILPPDRWQEWLSGRGGLDPAESHYLDQIELRPVSNAVGNVRNDGPELVHRVPGPSLAVSTMEPDVLF